MLSQTSQASASVFCTLNLSHLHSKHYLIFMVSIVVALGCCQAIANSKTQRCRKIGRGNVKIALEKKKRG